MAEKVIRTHAEMAPPPPPPKLAAAAQRLKKAQRKAASERGKAAYKAKLREMGRQRKFRKDRKVLKKPRPERYQTVHLTQRHVLSGKAYGPGSIRVDPDVAQVLMEQESRVRTTEQRLYENRAFVVAGGGRRVEVNPDAFAAYLDRMDPFSQIGG